MYGKYEFEISKLNNGNYFDSLTKKEIDVEFIYNKIKERYEEGAFPKQIFGYALNVGLFLLVKDEDNSH